ncbi:hypothetical protein [Aliidiomarina soli]|uniref:Uncharacterized protein n=1 Tax=Aliidiomarina soli TaxID=1928574 RepID=A0A432WE65_9GAMM|nr:hypothetical protein [Aliidiomarina soli]RUO31152.1 hypothetical protein CWE14_11700 [Aliidiomarina soli]
MSVDKFKTEIFDVFLYFCADNVDVNVSFYSESDFGNSVAQVKSNLGEFKITRERGLTFVDVMIPEKGYVRAEEFNRAVLLLQKRGNWTLLEQFQLLASNLPLFPSQGG